MTKTIHGIVHGRTIQLDEEIGLAEGQEVEVQVRVLGPTKPWGEGIRRSAGARSDDPHWDGIMHEIHEERKNDTRREAFE